MKKIHLVCNAHIDPLWQWDWNEGVGTAISTFKIAADFYIDNSTQETTVNTPMFRNGIDFADGTFYLNLNTNGNQGTGIGSRRILTSALPNVIAEYSSGTPTGVNFSVRNITQNTIGTWASNIQPGKSHTFRGVFNSNRANDEYQIWASAEGTAGNATVWVRGSN